MSRTAVFKAIVAVPFAIAIGLLVSGIGNTLIDPPMTGVEFNLQRPDYRPVLTTRSGVPLVDRDRGLRLALVPFTAYRNLGGQKTPSFVIDERGFRQDGAGVSSPRTFVLGGSTAFGKGLKPNGTPFSGILQIQNPILECVNAAVVGFVSSQELAEMVHRLDRYRPSLYIVFDGWNDLFDPWARTLGRSPRESDLEVFGGFVQIEEKLVAWSPSISDSGSETKNRDALSDRSPKMKSPEFFDRVTEHYVSNLEKMAVFSRSRGSEILVVFQPELGQKRFRTFREESHLEYADRSYDYDRSGFSERYARLIKAAKTRCDEIGVSTIDLVSSGVFVDSQEELFEDVVHINQRGHQLVAERIMAHLRSVGMAPVVQP